MAPAVPRLKPRGWQFLLGVEIANWLSGKNSSLPEPPVHLATILLFYTFLELLFVCFETTSELTVLTRISASRELEDPRADPRAESTKSFSRIFNLAEK